MGFAIVLGGCWLVCLLALWMSTGFFHIEASLGKLAVIATVATLLSMIPFLGAMLALVAIAIMLVSMADADNLGQGLACGFVVSLCMKLISIGVVSYLVTHGI